MELLRPLVLLLALGVFGEELVGRGAPVLTSNSTVEFWPFLDKLLWRTGTGEEPGKGRGKSL